MINPPKRFADVVDGNLLGYANLAKFALSVAETIDVLELNSNKEVIFSSEVE